MAQYETRVITLPCSYTVGRNSQSQLFIQRDASGTLFEALKTCLWHSAGSGVHDVV